MPLYQLSNVTYKQSECPICYGEHHPKCSYSPQNGFSYCRKHTESVEGFKYQSTNSIGFHVYRPGRFVATEEAREKLEEDLLEYNILDKKSLHSRLLKLQAKVGLSGKDESLIKNRGLSQAEFERVKPFLVSVSRDMTWNYALPGTDESGRWLSSEGILILGQDAEGFLLSTQIRRDSIKNKYVWTNDIFLSKRNEFGELPCTVYSFSPNPIATIFCEGYLKPLIAAAKNPHYRFIGSYSANFEPETLAKTIAVLGVNEAILAPDAGWKLNKSVTSIYQKLVNKLDRLGVTLHIADWGQAEDKSKPDVDGFYWNEI